MDGGVDGSWQDSGAGVLVRGAPAPSGAPLPLAPVLQVPDHLNADLEGDLDDSLSADAVVVQVVGLHGGAGTTSVAAWVGAGAADCGVGLSRLRTWQAPVLLVARTHARGLGLVLGAAQQWAAGGLPGIELLGVALVDDAPALSRDLERTVRSAERALPRSWRIGWSEQSRHTPVVLGAGEVSSRTRRTGKSIRAEAARARTSNTTNSSHITNGKDVSR